MGALDSAGRHDSVEYRELLAIVRNPDPSGALIIGGVGMGKRSLLASVLRTPGIAEPVMRLFCSPTLVDVPYGVLSPYLGELASLDSPVQVLRELNHALEDATYAKPKIVVVEDAQYLDPQSCFVLSLLVENAQLKLIAVGAGAVEPDSPLGTLAESTLMRTIVVHPLDLEGVRALVGSLINGRLSEGSLRQIWIATGGNPSLVEAYVASCLDQGCLYRDETLVQGHGQAYPLWVLARALPEVDDTLRDLVREQHRLTAPEDRRTLELLALGGSQPGMLLQACDSPYRRMLDTGQLRMLPNGTVTLTSRLHQLVLRQLVGAQRNGELYDQWQAASRQLELDPTPQQVLWGLELGHEPETTDLLQAVREAEANRDYLLAYTLCTISRLSRKSHAGALLEAKVLLGLRRFHSAGSLLHRLMEHDTDPRRLREAFNISLMMMLGQGEDAENIAALEAKWDERVREFGQDGVVREVVAKRQMDRYLMQLWYQLNTVGCVRPRLEVLEDLLSEPALDVEAKVLLLIMINDVHGIEGRLESAQRAAQAAQEESRREPRIQARYEALLLQRIGWNMLFLGQYEQACELIEANRGSRLREVQLRQGVLALLEGLSHLLQGRFRLASEKLVEAVTELRLNDPAGQLPLAVHLHEVALDRGGAQGTLATKSGAPVVQPEPTAQSGVFGGPNAVYRLWARAVAAAAGKPLGTDTLSDFPLLEREFLYSSTGQWLDKDLAGDDGQLRLAALAAQQQGERAQLVSDLARLRRGADASGLEALGQRAARHQEYRIAVEALARAAIRYSEAGDPRRCGELLRHASRILGEQRIDAGKYVSRALALAELTAREAEIVALVREGKNNAQIARTLTVSQRTVEGHLYRVFSKLGISERTELKHAGLFTEPRR